MRPGSANKESSFIRTLDILPFLDLPLNTIIMGITSTVDTAEFDMLFLTKCWEDELEIWSIVVKEEKFSYCCRRSWVRVEWS